MPLPWPMAFRGDESTRAMSESARTEGGPESEAMQETHGMVSLERAPHQELRKHYGLAYSVAAWESGRVKWRDCEASDG